MISLFNLQTYLHQDVPSDADQFLSKDPAGRKSARGKFGGMINKLYSYEFHLYLFLQTTG